MGNSIGTPDAQSQMATGTATNMDANYQYHADNWAPGPPAVMDLTKYIADDPTWWSLQCATPSCPSWLYLLKTRNQNYQRCSQCQKPWVESFFQLGPHKTWDPNQ